MPLLHGVELARHPLAAVALPALVVVAAGALIPLVAYPLLRRIGRLSRADAGSIAGHYGSVSVVTFAVGTTYLARLGQPAEGYMTVLLALLEFPALVIGVLLARRGEPGTPWSKVLHEVFAGKSIVLLLGGLAIGWFAGPGGIAPLDRLFFDLFKGMLAFFLLDMGLMTARNLPQLKGISPALLVYAVVAPLVHAAMALALGVALSLPVGDATLLMVLAASASYIAVPAVLRFAIPEARPPLYFGLSLGITFPLNILAGIPLYCWVAQAVLA